VVLFLLSNAVNFYLIEVQTFAGVDRQYEVEKKAILQSVAARMAYASREMSHRLIATLSNAPAEEIAHIEEELTKKRAALVQRVEEMMKQDYNAQEKA